MRTLRVFVDAPLAAGSSQILANETAHHLRTVLRIKPGQSLQVFNGKGGYFDANITACNKKQVSIELGQHHEVDNESPLAITLLQGISRGQKMDLAMQKAVELGVTRVIPVNCCHTGVKLEQDKAGKRRDHWQKIAINACEQCGRNTVPDVDLPQDFNEALAAQPEGLKIILHPADGVSLQSLDPPHHVILLVGPEGGFSETEIEQARKAAFQSVTLGPRVLRTETAAMAALAACQTLWGDIR